MTEVAIVGIGMHQFGRTEGVSGMDQGVVAVRRALSDAGASGMTCSSRSAAALPRARRTPW